MAVLLITLTFLFCLLNCRSNIVAEEVFHQPEQVHLALGRESSTIVVTWVTQNSTPNSALKYGLSGMDRQVQAIQTPFTDGGKEGRVFYIHRAAIYDLLPEKVYAYQIGSSYAWSRIFTFRSLPTHADWSPKLAIYGDMGATDAYSLPELENEVLMRETVDVILHVGDFAYDMDSDNARFGDTFMREIEPVASRVPYMTCPGNHEQAYNFSNYKTRFSMPGGDGEGQFYSFNLGPARIISLSSEFYYYIYYGYKQIINQYQWLKTELEDANKPENRQLRPWIIVMFHRPMYCSNSNDAMHCDNVENTIRTGFPAILQGKKTYLYGLEDLLYQEGVDIIIAAHEHSYERFWPVYNRTVCNASLEKPYFNPPAPVHIVTGSAGCSEGEDPFTPCGQNWSAFRSDEYGFTRMHIHNKTHLEMEQISVSQPKNPTIIDSVTVVKEFHGRGLYNCHQK